ncbi:cupin domain-containing protein [Chamaesiphon minutus]|uniref:Cupin domain-containing protein n=1 Tax=Chamaesiphon minutus (strain ATCC 27169 / PCC 6605) TaxID=1173020 RepID=K9UFP6_CHAP6|nr:cupin domain-containing protein [Chamaesiphon minutus]AFY93241.1 cupin domain-containing protein [Chamaesiphon minutus PCC 6605]
MTPKLTHTNPKILASGEGESHQLLTHTVVWKITTEDTNSRYAMFEMTDTVGGSAPAHKHPWEETFYILEGELDIQIGDRYETIGAGAVAHFPANAVHAFKIVSPVARVLIIVSPTIAEAFYREAGARITSFPPDPIVVQEICEKYNLQPQ